MSVPPAIRNGIRDRLWADADRLDWASLTASDKSRYYTVWTETSDIGGRLAQYMDPRQVRVYIKDTLLKSYTREASADPARALRVLGISSDQSIVSTYIKPHGCLLHDGRHIAWSKATEWKLTLMALYERSFEAGEPFAAVLSQAGARFALPSQRTLVCGAAERLGVKKVVWLD